MLVTKRAWYEFLGVNTILFIDVGACYTDYSVYVIEVYIYDMYTFTYISYKKQNYCRRPVP